MLRRRTFLSLVAGSFAVPQFAAAQQVSRKVALYANVGADLTHYDVDVEGGALIKQATVTLPAGVQYAWPHASRRYLYVATSRGMSRPLLNLRSKYRQQGIIPSVHRSVGVST